VLDVTSSNTYQWACLTSPATIPYDSKTVQRLASQVLTRSLAHLLTHSLTHLLTYLLTQYNLCVGGPALQLLTKARAVTSEQLYELCKYCRVFARVSPADKEAIVLAFNELGNVTLMCGDGTNDMGALKAAHVGISIVNDPIFEDRIAKKTKKQAGTMLTYLLTHSLTYSLTYSEYEWR